MGQILYGSARTAAAVRRAIQHSQEKESLKRLAARCGINAKTVAKWRKRPFVADAPMGACTSFNDAHSGQEAIAVAFRKHTLLPLDDCLYALQATIPRLTRFALHRCFQRHGISRLADLRADTQGVKKKTFHCYPIGYFHIDLTEVRTAQGKLHLFVAVDRTSKFAFARLVERANRQAAAGFLRELIETLPYKIHTILTDNGTHFTTPGNAVQPPPISAKPCSEGKSSVLMPSNSSAPATASTTARPSPTTLGPTVKSNA